MKISVVLANEKLNISEITLKTLYNEDDDSEDEQELGGGELMDTFTHFYSVLKDKTATEEECKDERLEGRPGECKKISNMVKVGAANVFTGAIGINSIGKINDRSSNVQGLNDPSSSKLME